MRRTRSAAHDGSVITGYEAIRADYNIAKENKYRRKISGIYPMGSGADYHYRHEGDFLKAMEIARDHDRNHALIPAALDRVCDNTLQDGIRLDPDTGDESINLLLKKKWVNWGNDPNQCDAAGVDTFNTIAHLTLRSTLCDGDIFHLPLKTGDLQTMEAHRCRTPRSTRKNVVHGVLKKEGTGKPVEYWFTKEDIGPMGAVSKVNEVQPVRARNEDGNPQVFHVLLRKRRSQTRGMTILAPCENEIGMQGDIEFGQMVKHQINSYFVLIRNRTPDSAYGNNAATGASTDETLEDGTSRAMTELAPGTELTGQPGETITGFSPNTPPTNYIEHIKQILSYIATNLGISRMILLLDPTESNFSSWRAAFEQSKHGFRRLQRLMVELFYRPIYLWKLRQWIATDPEIRAAYEKIGDDIFLHCWVPPRWAYIEPLKDAQADTKRIESGLQSWRGVVNEVGGDLDDLIRDNVNDQGMRIEQCIERAMAINEKYPEAKVTWRDVMTIIGEPPAVPGAAADAEDDEEDGVPQKGAKSTKKAKTQ